MSFDHYYLRNTSESDLSVYRLDAKKPKAILQISHGMAEHALRYYDFADYCSKRNLVVICSDHLGHGQVALKQNKLGHFQKGDWLKMIHDLHLVSEHIQGEYKGLPLVLLGHSMGSYLAQAYASLYGDNLKAMILSGSSYEPPAITLFGKMIALKLAALFGSESKANVLNKILFGAYNLPFFPPKTKFDWLSRDAEEVKKYCDDPLCGGIVSHGFLIEMFSGIHRLYSGNTLSKIPKNLPILFYSGDKDPLGKNTVSVKKLKSVYDRLEHQDLTLMFNVGGRHESLNESNRQTVYEEITNWLFSKIEV